MWHQGRDKWVVARRKLLCATMQSPSWLMGMGRIAAQGRQGRTIWGVTGGMHWGLAGGGLPCLPG